MAKQTFTKDGCRRIFCQECKAYIGTLYLKDKKVMSKKCPKCNGWNMVFPPGIGPNRKDGKKELVIGGFYSTYVPEDLPELAE